VALTHRSQPPCRAYCRAAMAIFRADGKNL
jgi:hypothetical protein